MNEFDDIAKQPQAEQDSDSALADRALRASQTSMGQIIGLANQQSQSPIADTEVQSPLAAPPQSLAEDLAQHQLQQQQSSQNSNIFISNMNININLNISINMPQEPASSGSEGSQQQ